MIDENKTYEANQELADVLIAEGYTEMNYFPNNDGKRVFAMLITPKKCFNRNTFYVFFDYINILFAHDYTYYDFTYYNHRYGTRITGRELAVMIESQKNRIIWTK